MKLVKPINGLLKSHFNSLYNQAVERAKIDFQERVEKELKSLDHFNQVKFVLHELNEIDKKVSESQFPFYVKNHSSEKSLLNQFASRTFLLNVDESNNLSESITLGTQRGLLWERERELKNSIPPYTYEEFLSGKVDPYFAQFEHFYNVGEEDYYNIRTWQSEALMKVVSYESLMIIRNIQQHVKSLNSPLDFILREKEITESVLEMAGPNATHIKEALGQLFICKGLSINLFDNSLLVENYLFYKSERLHWNYIFPAYVNPLIDKVNQKVTSVFSNEVTLFFTINKVSVWLEAVLSGRSLQDPVEQEDWAKIFAEVEEKASNRVAEISQELADFVEDGRKTKKGVKDYLFDQLESYRNKFNQFEDKHLFAFHYEEKRHLLKRQFITNAYFGNDIDEQSTQLFEAIVIHEVCWEIVGLYGHVFNKRLFKDRNESSSHLEIMELVGQMVLDKELYERMNKIMDDFFIHFQTSCLPYEIHFQNHKVLMQELFQKSLERLQTHLDDAEPSNKILFLQSRLKELRHRELEIKQLSTDRYFRKGDFVYTGLFREFLEIEAQFIKETADLELLPWLGNGQKLKVINAAPKIQEELLTAENEAFFLKMLEDLKITTNGKASLSERRKGALRGVIEAAIEKKILPQMSLDRLCKYVAGKIGMEMKSKLDYSSTSEKNKKDALKYILANYMG